jgi:hypothetical protein
MPVLADPAATSRLPTLALSPDPLAPETIAPETTAPETIVPVAMVPEVVSLEPQPRAMLVADGCEGHNHPPGKKKNSCQRPGCYERFAPSARSLEHKFCCALCRQALRRVLQREARWRKRLKTIFRRRRKSRGRPSAVG